MMEVLEFLNALRAPFGSALLLTGAVLAIIGTIGVLRFPDLYTRLHAASVTDTASVTLAVVGMALLAPSWPVVIKLAAIWLFIFLTGPTSSHALANAAHTAGLEPLIGRHGRGEDAGDVS